MEKIEFRRCVRPRNAVGKPVLIIFGDASTRAFGGCAYVRWELDDGSYWVTLLIAKGRVSPLKIITIVRLELNGAVIVSRLKSFIEK